MKKTMAKAENFDTFTQQAEVLQAFSRTLDREVHTLIKRPDLLWQQMYNRLQWGSKNIQSALEPEEKQRRADRSRLWVHTKTPFRESEALIRILTGNTAQVWACGFSPDGRWIVSAGWDRTLRVWDSATGQPLREWEATPFKHNWGSPPERVEAFSISPDSHYIVSTSTDGKLRFWDIATGQLLNILDGHTSNVTACAFSPDGRFIISASADNTLRLWDLFDQTFITLEGHTNGLRGCAFSPEGKAILSSCYDGTLRLWDATTGQLLRVYEGHENSVYACAFSPDGRLIASASRDKTLRLWNTTTGVLERIMEGHTGELKACAFSPDGELIVSACDDTLWIWDVLSGQLLYTLTGHTSEVYSCNFSPDGLSIVSSGNDMTLRLWKNIFTQTNLLPLEITEKANLCSFSPDGHFIVSSRGDNTLRIVDEDEDQLVRTFEGHTREVRDFLISPDGQLIVSSSPDSTLRIWDTATGQQLRIMNTGYARAPFAFSPDGRFIASAGGDRTQDGKYASAASDKPSNGNFIDLSWDAVILRVWDPYTGKTVRVLEEREGLSDLESVVHACSFSPDGCFIAFAGVRKIWVWDAFTGVLLHTLEGHEDYVNACVFSPDGRYMISSSGNWGDKRDNTLKVWDISSWKLVRTLQGHTGSVRLCEVSPDGCCIASISVDKTFRVWDLGSGKLLTHISLPGGLISLGLHPFFPRILCCDEGGNIYKLEWIGRDYGPIIVTAKKHDKKLNFLCPACRTYHTITQAQLGSNQTCPTTGCRLELKINSFTIGQEQEITVEPPSTGTLLPTVAYKVMKYDVFLCCSEKDGPVADAIIAGLENQGFRCCFPPRDVRGQKLFGVRYSNNLGERSAIRKCQFFVIILSGKSNYSTNIDSKIQTAAMSNAVIIPFRIENITYTGSMAKFLSKEHWVDAITPPLEGYIQKLIDTICSLKKEMN